MASKSVLCLATDGFEEIELVTPVDLLRRAGADVLIAVIGSRREIVGRNKIALVADALLGDVDASRFDLLLLPGGPGVSALREDGRAAAFAREFLESGRGVAAICAAPAILADAGVLDGRKFTAHHSMYEELPSADRSARVVVDGLVITSRGAGTSLDFGLALVRHLFGEPSAAEVAASVMA